MTHSPAYYLISALGAVFSPEEAHWLARLIRSAGPTGEVAYETIDLPPSVKEDYLLLAYEERLLLPRMSLPGSAWQDRLLTMEPGVVFFMPRFFKVLTDMAAVSGVFDLNAAIHHVLADTCIDATRVDRLLQFFLAIQPHALSRQIEAGLMDIINRSTTPDLDLHDTIDLYVLAGMISPCPNRSMTTGLAWYEIHPALYWVPSTAG